MPFGAEQFAIPSAYAGKHQTSCSPLRFQRLLINILDVANECCYVYSPSLIIDAFTLYNMPAA